ncbi:MAG: 3-phosphoshikimate 1-carboxyvinyltransferase [Eubacteriales bacterium]
MNLKIAPGILQGKIQAVSSKSHSQRLLIAAALSENPCDVIIKNTSEDIEATKACLANLKAGISDFPCEESGATLRFLLPVIAAIRQSATFYARGTLLKRPLQPLQNVMEHNGCKFIKQKSELSSKYGKVFQKIEGKLRCGVYQVPGNVSSQYITGLLFALPMLGGVSRIDIMSSLESEGYVDLSLSVLKDFGIKIAERERSFHIEGNQRYVAPAGKVFPEGDWSNAAFWIAADLISQKMGGKGVFCEGLNEKSLQSDRKILDIVRSIKDNYENDKTLIFDVSQIPDILPISAVIAAGRIKGMTKFINARRLRIKESDRLDSTLKLIKSLGGKAEEYAQSLDVFGTGGFLGGEVSGCGDHRIVMSAAIATMLAKKPVVIIGSEVCAKSYPTFFDDYERLGGKIYEN